MKKSLKIVTIVLIALIVIYAVAAIILTNIIKPNTYKTWISKVVYQQTGRIVKINGQIKLSFFPWIGARITQVQISNPKNFNQAIASTTDIPSYFAKIGNADLKISFFPLIIGKIEPKKLVLNNATLNLVTTPSGKTNWGDLHKKQPTQKKATTKTLTPKTTTKIPSKSPSRPIEYLGMPAITITNTNVNWINLQTDQRIALNDFNLSTQVSEKGQKVILNSQFAITSKKPAISLAIKASGTGILDFKQQYFQLQNFKLNSTVSEYLEKLKSPIHINLSGNLSLNAKKQLLELSNFQFNLANLNAKGSLVGKQIFDAPIFDGKLSIEQFNPSKLLNALKIKVNLNNRKVLQSAKATIQFQVSPKFIKLPSFQLSLDKIKIQGNVDFAHFNTPNLIFNLKVNQLNLGDYFNLIGNNSLTTSTQQTTKTAKPQITTSQTTTTKQLATKTILPIAELKHMNWQGALAVGSLTYHGLTVKNLNMTSSDKSGLIASSLQGGINNGQFNSTMAINVNGATPTIKSSFNVNNVPIEPILVAMRGKSFIQGNLVWQTKLNTSGNSQKAWLTHLNGTGKFNLTRGTIKNLNLLNILEKGYQFLKKQPISNKNSNSSTHFSTLQASYTITNGLLKNNDFQMRSQRLNAQGQGTVNLASQTINYHLLASYRASQSIKIPLAIKGRLSSPSISLNTAELTKSLLKQKGKNIIDKFLKKFL